MFTGLTGYDVGLLLVGAAALGAAILPRLIADRPISFPMLYVGAGVVVFSLPIGIGPWHPLEYGVAAEHLTELGVIVALMGVGLKIDRPFGWRAWAETWRLLGITMPVTIGLAALLGYWAVGLAPATAMLLGAVIAPTDPVLAADVQSGEPGAAKEGVVRFSLTSEAGLNDGLAFPFTNAAIAMAVAGVSPELWIAEWFLVALVVKIAVGVGVGWLVGRAIGYLAFEVSHGETELARLSAGLLALAATLFSYGAAEIAQGYGFIAVFVTALMIRESERGHEYHGELHYFAEQIERLLMAVILVLLGGSVVAGILSPLTWPMIGVALLLVLVVRPLAGLVGFAGDGNTDLLERGTIAFFGIRGIGSLYYLAHGIEAADFAQEVEIWALVGFVVILSVVLHGLTASPVVDLLERRETEAPGAA